jgi:predicted RNA-binding Zn-ribbon protein involved in translation (DUF1610 family)
MDFFSKLVAGRKAFCPGCSAELNVPIAATEYVCGACGEIFELDDVCPEDFIWHPDMVY